MSITIEVGGWLEVSGTQITLYVDPENNRVYTFSNVGNGQPMLAFHGRRMNVGQIPLDTVPASLEAWIAAREDQFLELIAEYEGHEFNGTDHKGRWSERAAELATKLDDELQDDLRGDRIQRYWDAAEWLDGDPQSVVDAAIATGSISESVEREVSDAAANGACIDPEATEAALRDLLRQSCGPRGDVDKIQALLAE